jgi:hypothetical protein
MSPGGPFGGRAASRLMRALVAGDVQLDAFARWVARRPRPRSRFARICARRAPRGLRPPLARRDPGPLGVRERRARSREPAQASDADRQTPCGAVSVAIRWR